MKKELIIRQHANGGFTVEQAVQKSVYPEVVAAMSSLSEVQVYLEKHFGPSEYSWPSPSLAEKLGIGALVINGALGSKVNNGHDG